MVDAFLQMAFSNTCFALAIGGVAVLVGAQGKRPRFAYTLWLLVFVKLVTPPALTIPIGLSQVQPTMASMTQPQTQMNTQPNPGSLLQGTSLLIRLQSTANQAKPWLASIRRFSLMFTNHIERTALWRLVQASVLVLTVGLLPLGIGCNSENSPVASDLTDPSAKAAKEDGTETSFRLSDVENNEDASDGERPTQNDGVDWRALMATPPEAWSDELKAQITAAGYDLKETADGIRKRQAWAAVAETPSEEWTQEQRNRLIGAGLDPEEVAARMRADEERDGRGSEGVDIEAIEYRVREIEAAVAQGTISPEDGRRLIEETRRGAEADGGPRDEEEALREFQRAVVERAMAIPPEEWDDEMKAAIVRAGWDLNEFTEGIRQRQAAMRGEEPTEDSGESDEDRIWREAHATDPDEWSEELKAQLLELAPGRTIEDIAGWVRERRAAMRKAETANDAGDGG